PTKIVKLASEYEVAVGQSVSLHCQAEGNPKPTYTWTPCESVCHQSTLNISGVLSDGVYTCKVTNGLGSDRRFTSL
ncbi:Vascular cell adhesion, partial [Desmophyllum pertusum]